MPELPDVEVFKQYVDATALHQEIDAVQVEASRVLRDVSPRSLRQTLLGRELASTRRHGKWLFAEAVAAGGSDGQRGPDPTWLALHFGMTGFLAYFKDPASAPDHVRLRLDFTDGYHLAYDCQRLFGEIHLVDDPDRFIGARSLGPDALGLSWETFRERLRGRRGMIKSTLMNQEVIAGIGNETSDEILFQARLHPKVEVDDLSDDALREVHRQMGTVLSAVIDARCRPEDYPDRFLNKHREEGAPCPAGCGGSLETIDVSGRTGYLCPRCQRTAA